MGIPIYFRLPEGWKSGDVQPGFPDTLDVLYSGQLSTAGSGSLFELTAEGNSTYPVFSMPTFTQSTMAFAADRTNARSIIEIDELHFRNAKGVYAIVKGIVPHEQVTDYVLTLHLHAVQGYNVSGYGRSWESGAPGMREAAVKPIFEKELELAAAAGVPPPQWYCDPIDPARNGNCRTYADLPRFDDLVPDHPLSTLRRVVSSLVATCDFYTGGHNPGALRPDDENTKAKQYLILHIVDRITAGIELHRELNERQIVPRILEWSPVRTAYAEAADGVENVIDSALRGRLETTLAIALSLVDIDTGLGQGSLPRLTSISESSSEWGPLAASLIPLCHNDRELTDEEHAEIAEALGHLQLTVTAIEKHSHTNG